MAVYTDTAIRRIRLDYKNVKSLESEGLFWIPDETTIGHGYAVIFGSKGTPYYGGAFCFEVTFPNNYPFTPPTFTYLTNDGRTRFNPNLYKNGKVCLSLLNTWPGEPWSGVQTLSSILQSIQTAVLNTEALRNEPAYDKLSVHTDIPVYDRLVQHAVVETAIIGYLKHPPSYLQPIYNSFKENFMKIKPDLLTILNNLGVDYDKQTESNTYFHMSQKYQFKKLAKEIENIH